jgi:hypothetical protein
VPKALTAVTEEHCLLHVIARDLAENFDISEGQAASVFNIDPEHTHTQNTFIRNVGKFLPDCMALYLGRLSCSNKKYDAYLLDKFPCAGYLRGWGC